jgi:gas vesicle protein
MQKHELKARVEGQIDEGKRNLDVMKSKADAATGDAKVAYSEHVSVLQKQYDELKVKAAAAWDAADDTWDDVSRDVASAWDEWTDRAKKAWDDRSK